MRLGNNLYSILYHFGWSLLEYWLPEYLLPQKVVQFHGTCLFATGIFLNRTEYAFLKLYAKSTETVAEFS